LAPSHSLQASEDARLKRPRAEPHGGAVGGHPAALADVGEAGIPEPGMAEAARTIRTDYSVNVDVW